MYDRLTVLNLVNDAERTNPACACGAPMIAVDRDGGLWLECSSRLHPRRGPLARLASLEWLAGHRRRVIISPEELQAA
jgi:hypothetical protein